MALHRPGKPPLGGASLACRARDAKWLWKNSPHKARLETQDSTENWRELGSQVIRSEYFPTQNRPYRWIGAVFVVCFDLVAGA